jgi:hypothetical protein
VQQVALDLDKNWLFVALNPIVIMKMDVLSAEIILKRTLHWSNEYHSEFS